MTVSLKVERNQLIKRVKEEGFFSKAPCHIEWKISRGLVDYDTALTEMEQRAQQIYAGTAPELVWLLEHPPLYTGGTSARSQDLLDSLGLPVYATGRGGEFTYHGPGQRIVYVLLNLSARQADVRLFIAYLEEWIIQTLADFGICGERRDERVGVWVQDRKPNHGVQENKIAAIGIRLKRWVSLHGFAINVSPNLTHYQGIIPCGIRDYGVTSFTDLGYDVSLDAVDICLRKKFLYLFTKPHDIITTTSS